ncbi:hypothetical protein HDU84_004469 [Entophlyctis sp. JEL0112]|nr:hypothetical protein HDU84_004469 [Entophlyctis sp. JEL0112]
MAHLQQQPQSYKAGTVGALKPIPVVAIDPKASVLEAACYMASRRVDAVLIASAPKGIGGIVTDKDLAYRVVAAGLDPKATQCKSIMTPDPIKVFDKDSATHALNCMISGQFRHLPVLDRDHFVVGLLDVTKCLYDSLEKLESAYAASRKAAVAAAQSFSRNMAESKDNIIEGSEAMVRYAEVLRQQLSGPNLSSLLTSESIPPVVGIEDTVTTACIRMKEAKETAVLVFDSDDIDDEDGLGNLCGIFTTKDLILRVLAASMDPQTTTIGRVMTPHPECVSPDTPVLDALRKMHAGRYLHLPVTNSQGVIEGLVDVLKLTYTTLTQLSRAQDSMGNTPGDLNISENFGGPVWERFWTDASSSVSSISEQSSSSIPGSGGKRESRRASSANLSTRRRPTGIAGNVPSLQDETASIFPDDSASVVGVGAKGPRSIIIGSNLNASSSVSLLGSGDTVTFKLKDFERNVTHRFALANLTGLSTLKQMVATKLSVSATTVHLCYIDDEGDVVRLDTDEDLLEAMEVAKRCGWGRVVIFTEGQREFYEHYIRDGGSDGGTVVGTRRAPSAANSKATKDKHARTVSVQELEQMEAMVAPALIGVGVAVVCAFLLGRAFK